MRIEEKSVLETLSVPPYIRSETEDEQEEFNHTMSMVFLSLFLALWCGFCWGSDTFAKKHVNQEEHMADIRHIEEKDQLQLSNIIRSVFEEYGAPLVNTVYDDPRTEHVFDALVGKNAEYWVVVDNGVILGGCGYYPTEGLPEGYAELVKSPLAYSFRSVLLPKESSNLIHLHDIKHLEQGAFDRSMPALMKMAIAPMGKRMVLMF